ncbi:MAG: ROK family transcriptional regulator [Actinobacteria bacterium]|nr:ROK family transcriptional regulator [Actinomycetota bacterium]
MNTVGKQKILKQINRKRILNLLRDVDELPVSELAAKANLSKPTIMKIMKYYIDKGLVVISGKGSSTEEGGKKPNIFKFNANGGYAVGMIITANKLKAAITNLKGEVASSISMDLENNENLESVVGKISKAYERLINNININGANVFGMAMGIYGLTDYDKGIVFFSPHYPSWGSNIKMREKIRKVIPDNIPIILDNISRFQVFGERALGAGRNLSNVVSIMAGYGLGSGVIIEGNIKRGHHKIMGEVGHMVINPYEEMLCACGSKGCFEVMVSIDRLKKIIELNKASYPNSEIFNSNPDNIDIKSIEPDRIFKSYRNRDKLARLAFDDVINWFAIGLSNIILIYDPQLIIIHGIYTKAGDEFLKKLRKKVEQIALTSVKKETKIKYSELGEMSGVLGAATYVINEFFD